MTTEAQSAPGRLGVAIGFDGSPNSEVALRYGAEIALRKELPLTVVTAYRTGPQFYAAYAALPQEPEEEVKRRQAEQLVRGAADLLEGQRHGEVSLATVEGDSVGALAEMSRRADLIVLGARGRGGFLGRVLGSVADALPGHAACPAVIVPEGEVPADGPVVVGTDGSEHGRRAIDHAAQEAAERGAALRIVMALPMPDSGEFWYPMLSDGATDLVERRRTELQAELDEEIARVRERVDGLEVSAEVIVGIPATVLQDASRGAQLTVVGSRGRGAITSALLGSVSRGMLHGAEGPVMVVPSPRG